MAANAELQATFGDRYIDLRSYMVNHAIYDAGITPTATDVLDMAADCIPTSLLYDNVHFNSYQQAGLFIARAILART